VERARAGDAERRRRGSQFFDPATGTGPATQESGRVTALAIDPNCGKASAPAGAPCRLWVAAAGGGIWRTNNALAATPAWIAPPASLPTNAFGSLVMDANDASGNTLYAGSGEPNGSGDSEAGLGLFKSTDGGQSWSLVAGSQPVAINRSIGAIVVKPGAPGTIYIGTDVARHGSSAANGGRRTPPNAPALGVYKSTDGGATFTLATGLATKTPPNPAPASSGVDWFQGGITKLELDPNNANAVYAAVVGYGVWRSTDGGAHWVQVFQTMNPADTFGDRTEFDAVDAGGGKTRIYLGDSSDDLFVARVYRTDDAASIAGSATGGYGNAGWTELSSAQNGTNGFLAYGYCQNGQCGYDDFVTSPASQPGVAPGHAGELWLGGSMNYDELPAYAGLPPRSNGRGVIRSTNAAAAAAAVTWADMSATLGSAPAYAFTKGIHPDQHAVVFDPPTRGSRSSAPTAASSRLDVRTPRRLRGLRAAASLHTATARSRSARRPARLPAAAERHPERDHADQRRPEHDPVPVAVRSTRRTRRGPARRHAGQRHLLLHRLDDLVRDRRRRRRPVGLRRRTRTIRYHNYYDATPEVNFHGNDPQEWLDIYDPAPVDGRDALVLRAVHRRPGPRRPRLRRARARLADRRQRR
jgi:hypothetical protein